MKRTTIPIFAALIVLAMATLTFGQTTDGTGSGMSGPNAARERPGQAQERMALRLQQQIDQVKAEHQELITELRAIHAAAVKEKATQTAGQIQTLIVKQQETLRDRIQRLESQRQRLQRAGRPRPARTARPQRRGRPAADFELNSFDGRAVKLSNLKDQIVVLEWFNYECPFSKYHYESASTMVDLARKYREKGVVWFAVNSTGQTAPALNQAFAKQYKLPYPILDDRTGRVGRIYGARTTPHVFIIDKEGIIVYDGAIDSAPLGKTQPNAGKINYVDKALAELTSGRDVSLPTTPPYGCAVKYGPQ